MSIKAIPTQGLVPHSRNPFIGIQHERLLTFRVGRKNRRFRVLTYQAYSAMGLIGPEYNGVAVCDEDYHTVICDRIKNESTGYFGVSQTQVDEFERICEMAWPEFKDYVNAQPRLRQPLAA